MTTAALEVLPLVASTLEDVTSSVMFLKKNYRVRLVPVGLSRRLADSVLAATSWRLGG